MSSANDRQRGNVSLNENDMMSLISSHSRVNRIYFRGGSGRDKDESASMNLQPRRCKGGTHLIRPFQYLFLEWHLSEQSLADK